ncbi:MAG: hypothetical protein RTU30_05295 [Candidatus Thorarchaeota archaeon]
MSLYDFGTGGFDIEFRLASLAIGEQIIVCSKVAVTATDADDPSTAKSYLVIEGNSGSGYDFSMNDKSSSQVDKFESDLEYLGVVRVIFHNEFCSVYVDHNWIYTFAFETVYHPEDPEVGLKTGGASIAVYDIRMKELSDWREAIFIDLETSTKNAISSAILQRPVDIYANYQGKLKFLYSPTRETVALDFIRSHRKTESADVPMGCSDALVSFAYATVVNDLEYAEKVGFVTRFYRLPSLDNGAVEAARILQERARQSRISHTIAARIDPRVEVGDIVQLSETLSGTGTSVDHNVIVETLSFQVSEGRQQMSISGRDADE